jgi:hypothetical protein
MISASQIFKVTLINTKCNMWLQAHDLILSVFQGVSNDG